MRVWYVSARGGYPMTLLQWAFAHGVTIKATYRIKRVDSPQRIYGATRHGIIETGKRKGEYAESPRRIGLPGDLRRYDTL